MNLALLSIKNYFKKGLVKIFEKVKKKPEKIELSIFL